jgi:hypothetical protein
VRGHLICVARDNIAELYGLDTFGDDASRLDYVGRLLEFNVYTLRRADRGLPHGVCDGSLSWYCYSHRLQQRASFFLAEELPIFLFRHFFGGTRQRARRGCSWYTELTTDISPILGG